MSASAEPTEERLHVVPRPMETDEGYEMIDAFANAAARTERGARRCRGCLSHSYLPAQFWSPNVNDRNDEFGGQVTAYTDLEHRGRYENWLDTLVARFDEHDVTVEVNTPFTVDDVDAYDPDELVLATVRVPDVPIAERASTYTATEALADDDPFGGTVLVSDWDGNETALYVATRVVAAGSDVEIVTSAYTEGESVQQYIQNALLGHLYAECVTLTPHHRVDAPETDTVVLRNVFNDERRASVDTVVFAHGGEADYEQYRALAECDVPVRHVGECWAPRSLDEALQEGFEAAADI